MGSKRLEQFQSAIQRLTEAQLAGSAAEIAAAQALLSTPLAKDLTPQQILEAGQARLDQFGQVLQRQEDIVNWAEAATAGIKTAAVNLEGPDRLGIPAAEIDAEIDSAFGITAQAELGLFLDKETRILIQGRRLGELPAAAARLAEVIHPGEEVTPSDIAPRLKIRPNSVSSTLKRAGESFPDVVIQSMGKGRYARSPALIILGEEPPAPVPISVVPSAEAGPPVTFPMRKILQQPGIAGVLSESQARHLIQGLVASGHLSIGVDAMEGRAQRRGKGQGVVRDLELTGTGVLKLKSVAERFRGQGKIYVKSVAQALEEWQEPKPAAPAADAGQKFWGAQIVADLKNVGTGALKTLRQTGILKEDEHYKVTASGKRVFLPKARPIVKKLDKAAAAAQIGRITREFVLKTFGPSKKVKSKDQPAWENPYGPNGPAAANNDLVEFVIAGAINDCLRPDLSHPEKLTPLEIKTGHPPTEQTIRLAGEVAMRLVVLGARLGLGEQKNSDAKLYPEEYEALNLPEGGKSGANRLAAAAIMELAQNARPFNFIRRERPTYEFALTMVKGLKQIGRPDLIEAMAHNLANPKPLTGEGEWSGGVRNLNHQSPLD